MSNGGCYRAKFFCQFPDVRPFPIVLLSPKLSLPDVVVCSCRTLEAVMKNLFSVPIFFIVFRETLETAIIISVLLAVVEQIVYSGPGRDSLPATESEKDKHNPESGVLETPPSLPSNDGDDASSDDVEQKKLLRKLRIQVDRVPILNSTAPPVSCAYLALYYRFS